jgi:hypothetical protein
METQPVREPKTIVTRTFTVKEKVRYVTIHYEHNRPEKTLKYGASIHRMSDDDNTKFDKAGHVATAKKRFTERPITITNFISDKDTGLFHKTIRMQLHTYGVQSPKNELKVYELSRVPVMKPKKVTNSATQSTTTPKVKKVSDITLKKEMKPEVSRLMNFRKYKKDTKEIVTIQYKYDRVNKKIQYGATIYKAPLNAKEKYDSAGHKETAMKRFDACPVVVENFTDDGGQKAFNMKLRSLLHTHGVKAKTQ